MRVHLMGAGGAGVSALARVFLARGDEVSGCDVKESETTRELEDAGVRIHIGHDPEHVLFQDLLVYSGAIKSSPELDAARAMGVKVLSRAEMLAELINESDSIAIAGTAGKTSVTLMVGHILVTAGYAPTVLVGDGSSSRTGKSSWLVAETDESDGTLTLHHPRRAIVTNIELDHPDHFRDVSAVRELFQWFILNLPDDGLAVVCADDELARELKPKARRVTYGFRHDATYRSEPIRPFPIHFGGHELGRINLRQPGRHNIQNATGAAAVALEIGAPFPQPGAPPPATTSRTRRAPPPWRSRSESRSRTSWWDWKPFLGRTGVWSSSARSRARPSTTTTHITRRRSEPRYTQRESSVTVA